MFPSIVITLRYESCIYVYIYIFFIVIAIKYDMKRSILLNYDPCDSMPCNFGTFRARGQILHCSKESQKVLSIYIYIREQASERARALMRKE